MRKIFFLLFFLFSLCSNLYASEKTNHWPDLAEQDLVAMHQILQDNSPATAGYGTKAFNSWVDTGYRLALKKATLIDSFGGYRAVLLFYVTGFHSEHFWVSFLTRPDKIEWPGFIVAIRDHRYRVVYTDAEKNGLPPTGSDLVECDGLSPDELVAKNVLPFSGPTAIPWVKSTWAQIVPSDLFFDDDNPWFFKSCQCTFVYKNKRKTYRLDWKNEKSGALKVAPGEIPFGPTPALGVHRFGKNARWIAIPTFEPDIKKGVDPLEKIIDRVGNDRKSHIIVFDLRGNSGGDGRYGPAIIKNLYGIQFLQSLGKRFILNDTQVTAFRISPRNLAIFQRYDTSLYHKALTADKQGKKVVFETTDFIPHTQQAVVSEENPVTAKVFVLTDGRCDSSCWLFVRQMRQIPNVVQVGQPTHFMTVYSNPNMFKLPGEMASFAVPMQVFIRPLDHFGKPFVPQCIYPGYMGDTAALQRWIIQLASHPKSCAKR